MTFFMELISMKQPHIGTKSKDHRTGGLGAGDVCVKQINRII